MAVIKPIKGIRPQRDKAHLVVSRAVNTYKKSILNAKLEENPFTFLHVILPEFGKKVTTKPNSTERFKLVKKKYQSFVKDKILIEDKKESLYIYKQIKDGIVYVGIIGGASVDDYDNGIIKIHEQTLTKRVEVFTNYLSVCEFNAEPVLLTYEDNNMVNKILSVYLKTRAEYEFTTADAVSHYLWLIQHNDHLKLIKDAFAKTKALYIADGHHRSSSSSLLASKINKSKKVAGMHNYFLSLFIAKSQLQIFEFNRYIHDLNGLNAKSFLEKIKISFQIKEVSEKGVLPDKKHEFGLYLENKWYKLTLLKGKIKTKNPLQNLDAQIINDTILNPILNIKDLKTDPKVSFVGGKTNLLTIKNYIDKGKAKAALILFPADVSELMSIADEKLIMPPKSTYIEPKLRSGLVIQSLK